MPHHFVAERPTVKVKDGVVHVDTHRKDGSIHVYTVHNFLAFLEIARRAMAEWQAEQRGEVIRLRKRKNRH